MIKITRPQCPNESALNSGNYKHADNKEALKKAGFDKCMYCESKISHTYYGDIEHIKPKSIFPKLEFVWRNLGFVCAKCNGMKKDKFNESCPFVNPYEEEPENHIIAVGAFIKHKQGSERGEITITEIDLNRLDLLERRKETIDQMEKTINACFRTINETLKNNALAELKNDTGLDREYSLCVKYLLKAHQIYDQK
jgi:hypothetical protein